MAEETRKQLKTYFETGDIPTQDQFYNVLDSYVHKLDDGLTFFLDRERKTMNVGFGVLKPHCPIMVKADIKGNAICIISNDEKSGEWHLQVNPSKDGKEFLRGFNIAEETSSADTSRLFIQGGNGLTGIGTNQPTARLHITDASSGSATSLKIQNAMVGTEAGIHNRAWQLGHIHDPSLPERIGTFSVLEETDSANLTERITVLPGQNVGINEEFPDTTLHINRDVAETLTKVQLIDGSGIVTVGGLIGQNLVLDYQSLQARAGNIVAGTSTLSITASTLNLNPLGGDVLLHGDASLTDDKRVIVTSAGKVGVGTITPSEQLHLTGAVSDAQAPAT